MAVPAVNLRCNGACPASLALAKSSYNLFAHCEAHKREALVQAHFAGFRDLSFELGELANFSVSSLYMLIPMIATARWWGLRLPTRAVIFESQCAFMCFRCVWSEYSL